MTTITDLFCGAGGSSLGAELAGGTLRLGLNHWERAIETHATNFQHADHDCADVSALTTAQIRRYPDTDILLASPECTNHSLAKGARRRKPQAASLFDDGPAGDDEQDRSRSTMWDVVRFVEQKLLKGKPYKAVVVENVVDAFRWGEDDNGQTFAAWLLAMAGFGYEHEIVWLNSMFCPPTPQSRDRMYVVFWRRGIRRPDLRFEPPAWCPSCERVVDGRQWWKRELPRTGGPGSRYGAQYLYRCPTCHGVVIPGAYPAATAIDWSLPAGLIGERTRPLKPATRERIRRGLERLSREPFAVRLTHGGMPRPLTLPLVTLTQRHDVGVVIPVAGNTFERTPGNRARRADLQPGDTIHGTLDRALVMANTQNGVPRRAEVGPAQTVRTEGGLAAVVHTGYGYDGHRAPRVWPVEGPVGTIVANLDRALVFANRANNVPKPAAESPTAPVLTGEHLGVVHLRQHQSVRAVEEPVGTVSAGGGHHGVVMRNNKGGAEMSTPTHEPIRTITTRGHQSLVIPYYRDGRGRDGDGEPAPTVSTRDRVALVVPAGGSWRREATSAEEPHPTVTGTEASGLAWSDDDIDDCRFRMFALHEIADTMVMRRHTDGSEYVVVGNKRERMAQYGNAVTPPVMHAIVERLLEVV